MSETKVIKSKLLPRLYIIWSVIVISLIFLKDQFSRDNITHLVILLILLLSLITFKNIHPKNPKRFFIFSSIILAALVEGAYMITNPVLPSLLTGKETTFFQFVQNYGIDLLLTIPIYYLVFWAIWWLINKYNYSKWEYIFLIALGQSLGDGSGFFILQPGALIFLPYIMINYHAMNVAPFLSIQKIIANKPKSDSRWKYLVAVLMIFLIYILGGTFIQIVAKMFNLS